MTKYNVFFQILIIVNALINYHFTLRPIYAQNSANNTCPNDLETLTQLLVRDLPNYANRVNQSARNLEKKSDRMTYFIVAGKPDFQPIPLRMTKYHPEVSEKDIYQVFITTLERTYNNKKMIQLQQYHWILLTKNNRGWYLVMLFSSIGSYPSKNPPSPPRDNTSGIVGESVNIWLRDCREGFIKKL
ncbi:MAG TPA: hypothetical protein V6C58_27200 [Allocoleopsis sp.]